MSREYMIALQRRFHIKSERTTELGHEVEAAHDTLHDALSREQKKLLLRYLTAEDSFREMVVMDAVMANVDRHSGNYGFLVDNATGEIEGMAPLFDHNMACLPMMMENDDFDDYLSMIGPKIGTDFVAIARALITPAIRSKLIDLKDFTYEDPGLGYPQWKLDAANKLKDRQIDAILK